jgi:peptidoglycan hydrolase-like protein with peptidoglycan-binding domain
MMRLATLVFALALGLVWSAAVTPVGTANAQDKTTEIKDKASETARDAKETLKSAGEKVKEKTIDVKEEIKAKLRRSEDGGVRGGSADVKKAQEALRAKGFDPGSVDGAMGPRTSAAVRDFQKRNGLPVTGRLDAATASRLGVGTGAGGAEAPSASPATGRRPRQTP